MSRLVFPDEGSRLVLNPATGKPMPAETGHVYTDSAGTTAATDLLDANGDALTSGLLATDGYGWLPLWSGPDGVDTLYVQFGTGPVWPVYARVDDRLDAVVRDYAHSNPVVALTYNADGTVATSTEDTIVTTFAYNADGTVHTTVRLGVTRTFSYNGDGTLAGVV